MPPAVSLVLLRTLVVGPEVEVLCALQGMQQMLEETELESREMRRKYVALGNRVADLMRPGRTTASQCQEHLGRPLEVQV